MNPKLSFWLISRNVDLCCVEHNVVPLEDEQGAGSDHVCSLLHIFGSLTSV